MTNLADTAALRATLKDLPVAEILSRYNALAADAEKPTLKAWKGPKDQLINRFITVKEEAQRIFDEKLAAREAAEMAAKTTVVEPAAAKGAASQPHTKRALKGNPDVLNAKGKKARVSGDLDAHPLVKEENARPKKDKKAKKADAPKKATKKTAPAGDTVSLADIARELGQNPKVLRAKARRKDAVKKLLIGEGWNFRTADKAAVLKLLKGAE